MLPVDNTYGPWPLSGEFFYLRMVWFRRDGGHHTSWLSTLHSLLSISYRFVYITGLDLLSAVL